MVPVVDTQCGSDIMTIMQKDTEACHLILKNDKNYSLGNDADEKSKRNAQYNGLYKMWE